ncbi:MAG: ABC transporter transmembrane domain-containing protein, partial [Deinococcales bacterium]
MRRRLRSRAAAGGEAPAAAIELAQVRRLLSFTRPYRVRLVIGIVAVGVSSAFGLAFPLLIRDLFNVAFGQHAGAPGLNRIALILLGLFLAQAVFNYVRTYNLGLVGEALVADLRKALFGHVIDLSVRFFEARKTGEITSRLTLVMLAIVPAVVLAAAYFGRRLRRISTRFQDAVGEANASAEEAISGVRVVKSFTAEDVERRRYGAGIDVSYRLALRRLRVRALFIPTVILAMFSGIGVVLWYGGRLVLAGALQGGDLIAFLLITVFVAGSIGSFTGLYSQLQEALGASRR